MDYKAEDIIAMIRSRYDSREWAVLEQVADGTGLDQRRWIDVAAFSLWPSKGLTRAAFEVKVHRGDFIRELQNPIKHQWARESFHEFWFAGPREIFQDAEIPKGVGLMCPRGNKLTIRTHCSRNNSPKLDDSLLAAFMRGAAKEVNAATTRNKQEVLQDSPEFQRARAYEEAVGVFCESHGVRHLAGLEEVEKETLLAKLEEAITDKQFKKDRDQLLAVSERFQNDVAGLLNLFVLIAQRSILSRDELGKYVVGRWGGDDTGSLEYLKRERGNNYQKRYIETIELLLNWERETTRT